MNDRSRHYTAKKNDQFFADCMRYLDGEMSPTAFASFQSQLIGDDRRKEHFVDLVLHSETILEASQSMRSQEVLAMAELYAKTKVLNGMGAKEPYPELTVRDTCSLMAHLAVRALSTKAAAVSAIAAALLLTAVFLIPWNEKARSPVSPSVSISTPPATKPQAVYNVAKLTAAHNVNASELGVNVGEPFQADQILILTQGLAEVTTNRGARVLLEAPCEVRFSANDNALQLVSGRICAFVPGQATGFTVQTSTARIIDVGTEFGVEVATDGTTHLQVYDGEVRASAVDAEGQANSFVAVYAEDAVSIRQDTGLERAAFEPSRHERDIAIAALRPSFHPHTKRQDVARGMWWRGEMPEHLGSGREKSDSLQVFIERSDVLLQQDVKIDLNDPGNRLPQDYIAGKEYFVEAGKRVDVYLLHFDPKAGREDWDKGFFKVTFGGKILGIACLDETIAGVDRALGLGPARYPIATDDAEQGGPGLELDFGDVIKIIPEGYSLELTANATTSFDQILVLVESSATTEEVITP